MAKRNTGLSQFSFVQLVHSLFSADLLNRVLTGDPKFEGNRADSFQLARGLTVADEAARAWRIALGAFQTFGEQERSAAATTAFARTLLTEALGYRYTPCPQEGILPDIPDQRSVLPGMEEIPVADAAELYPITALLSYKHTAPEIPLLVVPEGTPLDRAYHFADGRRKTPFALMQEYLDHSDRFLWAIVTNGSTWRILRDSTSVALSTYLDLQLGDVLETRNSEAFSGVYRLMHASRPARQDAYDAESCLWEKWRKELEQGGERVREGLSGNVQQALRELGCGFLQHSANTALQDALTTGRLTPAAYYNELLRLVYRFIFLFVMEERDLLHAHAAGAEHAAAREAYRRGYSMARLVQTALRPHSKDRYDDVWQSVRIVFKALGQDEGEPLLALPALGGLFDTAQCSHLDTASLSNKVLYSVMRLLRWSAGAQGGQLLQIDYRNMGSEELGSVYEELLELTPQVNLTEKRFYFTSDVAAVNRRARTTDGNKRKTTGSYYTPPCLVELLVHKALDPLIEERRSQGRGSQAREALLSLRIIDPACGSGHFLLSAARHLAQAVAEVTTPAEPERSMRQAMHDVVANCIYGVDLNPMAIELVRMNLWLEGYQPNKPLSFLDHHLICGNSLLGILKPEMLFTFIPKEAYKAAPGDDKEVCKAAAAANRTAIKTLHNRASIMDGFIMEPEDYFPHPEAAESPSVVRLQQEAYVTARRRMLESPDALSADAFIGAFIMPKTELNLIPTTATVRDCHAGMAGLSHSNVAAAHAVCRAQNVLHWPLQFPSEMRAGGFDCVLGNPPWEQNKIKEQEWFATRYPAIADAAGVTRQRYIELLKQGYLTSTLNGVAEAEADATDQHLYRQFESAIHLSQTTSQFYNAEGMRYPLTGRGTVNLYALFAETCLQLCKEEGSMGILLPSGIATDDSTKAFFCSLTEAKRLASLYDFENREKLFPAVDSRVRFSALTSAFSEQVDMAFFLTHPNQLQEEKRHLSFRPTDFRMVNPNTGTTPIPRSKKDAELMLKIYNRVPVLCNEATGVNPWGVVFRQGLFNMTLDSGLFMATPTATSLPLYEGKMIHHYDHRWATFLTTGDKGVVRDVTQSEKENKGFEAAPRYWVEAAEVNSKLADIAPDARWLLGFRDIARATDMRTFISAFLPKTAVGHKAPLIFVSNPVKKTVCCLQANFAAICFDYIVRSKVGGTSMTYHYVKQFPVLPPDAYSEAAVAYITERVVKLTYTSESMRPFAEDMGYAGDPIVFNEEERAVWRAELDAVYAKLYGLSREELSYILDPATYYGDKCPTVTFPTLKANEMKAYGEYRTQRLVLEAYDRVPDFTLPQ